MNREGELQSGIERYGEVQANYMKGTA